MSITCTKIETDPRPRLLAALITGIRNRIEYALLVSELRALSPPLLADVGIARWQIPAFARSAVWGHPLDRSEPVDEPTTTIGSDTWCRAYVIRMGG